MVQHVCQVDLLFLLPAVLEERGDNLDSHRLAVQVTTPYLTKTTFSYTDERRKVRLELLWSTGSD